MDNKTYTKLDDGVFKKIDPAVEKEALLREKNNKVGEIELLVAQLNSVQNKIAECQAEIEKLDLFILDVEEVQPVAESEEVVKAK